MVRRSPMPHLERHHGQPPRCAGRQMARPPCSVPIPAMPTAIPGTSRAASSPANIAAAALPVLSIDGTDHRHRRWFRRQAAQLPQRRGGKVRRQRVVHRSRLRHSRSTSPPVCANRPTTMSSASILRPAPSPQSSVISTSPTGSLSRPTSRCSTSPTPPLATGPDRNSHIRRFRVRDNGTLEGGEVFATTIGIPDGMRVDTAGNLWASAGTKIDVYAPDGTLLGADRRLSRRRHQPDLWRTECAT